MPPTHLFTDIGGVLLTNGWDRDVRLRAAAEFHLDPGEMDERHHLTYDTYESGKIDLTTYLDRVVFFQPRPFTYAQFADWVLSQARAFPETIALVRELKARHGLKVGVVSNEGREIGADRVTRFGLAEFADFFVISGCVGLRKPDEAIFRLALDMAQVAPEQVVYLEDRRMFADVAAGMGMRAVWHRDAATTRAALTEMGLSSAGA